MDKDIIYDILKNYWNYTSFRPLQEDIITSVLEGHDTLGLLPTGGGKSLTFQVPTMCHDGITLVITPLISLMKDQVDALIKKGIKATYLYSGLTMSEIRKALDKCIYGKCKFLYFSPERLNSKSFIDTVRLMNVSLIVVDEAHCISQWGYDFRPSYLGISQLRNIFPSVPVLALTASATPEVANDIIKNLGFKNYNVYSKSFSRPNIVYAVRKAEDKLGQTLKILKSVGGSGIVYVRSRRKTKEIAEFLCSEGIPATYYHAGLSTEEKNDIQNKWINNGKRIIVATNAFGMGIDKPDVRIVVHYDCPSSIEEYYQEAGRAGRDEKKSYAALVISKHEKATLYKKLADLFPPKDFIKNVYDLLGTFLNVAIGEGYNNTYEFNFPLFCKQNQLPVTATFNALKILTQANYIEFIEEIEMQSRVMILCNKEELYAVRSENENVDYVLQILLRQYTSLFADYVFINEDLIAYRGNITSEDVYNALIILNNKHILHYIPRKRTPYIYYSTSRELPKYLRISTTVYEQRKEIIKKRIDSMINYAYSENQCRENIITEYFGEKNDHDCNHCDICIAKRHFSDPKLPENVTEGIKYVVTYKGKTLNEILNTLSFPKETIITEIRNLISEGVIIYDPENEIYILKK